MKTVTICGSMRFEKQMQKIALELETGLGWNVLQCIYQAPDRTLTEQEVEALTKAHYRKIDLSDAIYVVDIGGYIGNAVTQEIQYAEESGKEVLFHSDLSQK